VNGSTKSGARTLRSQESREAQYDDALLLVAEDDDEGSTRKFTPPVRWRPRSISLIARFVNFLCDVSTFICFFIITAPRMQFLLPWLVR